MTAKKKSKGFSDDTVGDIWNRDRGRCAMCGRTIGGSRGINWSVHHRWPRGMGGSSEPFINLPSNGVLLCGSGTTGCHGYLESHRSDAEKLGFIIRSGVMRPHQIEIKHFLHGVVYLTTRGTTSTVEPADY